jgi:hypothetical protein
VTVLTYGTALGAMLVMVVPLSWASMGLRRMLFLQWNGPLAWLAQATMTLMLWLLLAEAFGLSPLAPVRPWFRPAQSWARLWASGPTIPGRPRHTSQHPPVTASPLSGRWAERALRAVAVGAAAG